MSSYLSHLAATVVHPGGGVQPRLPGRFEPRHRALAGVFDFEVSDDPEATDAVEAFDYDEPPPITQPVRSSGDPTPPTADVARPHDGPVPSTARRPPPASSEPSEANAAESPADAVKAASVSPAPARDISPAVNDEGRSPPADERRPMPPLAEAVQPVRPQPPTAVPPVLPDISPASMSEPSAPDRPDALDSLAFARESMPLSAALEESRRQIEPVEQLGAEKAPTIQVTIGRIEVRATTRPAPQPPPRPVRRKPVLTLDEYLKQRRGDRR